MNHYTDSDLVRLEILNYDNPEGLHPVEREWRNLARKLKEDVVFLQNLVDEHDKARGLTPKRCSICETFGYKPIKFPEPFKP